MKRFLLILLTTCSITLSATAQDVIVLKNTSEIQAKVKSIGLNEIVYLKWDNLDGPTYTLLKSDIFFIKYANGQKETFVTQDVQLQPTPSLTEVKPKQVSPILKSTKEEYPTKRPQGYAYLGADFTSGFGGPLVDFSAGVRFSKYIYVGGGFSWHHLIGDVYYETPGSYYYDYTYATMWLNYFNLTADIKAYIPTKSNFYPRFDLSVGPTIGGVYESYYGEYAFAAGFYMSAGAGFDYKAFSFGAGFQMPIMAGEVFPLGYVKIGVRFGSRY